VSEQTISIRRRISGLTLLLVWVMVFALPAFLVLLSLNYLFDLARIAKQRAVAGAMTSEMEIFRQDLIVANFIQNLMDSYYSGISEPPDYRDPASAMAGLASATGLQPDGIICHSADTADFAYHFTSLLAEEIKTLPRNLMRRYLVNLNQQLNCKFYSQQVETATRAMFRFADSEKTGKDLDQFFRRVFALITEIPLIPQRVSKSISSQLSGVVYFYYKPFITNEPAARFIKGGCLLIFRGAEIPWKKAALAAARRASPGLVRSFVGQSHSLWNSDKNNPDIVTRFYEDNAGYHLISTFSQTSLIDLTQGGTLSPLNLRSVAEKMPLLKVSVPWSQLQHPLLPWLSHITFVCRLYMLFGAFFILRFFFFGIEFRAGITSKVVVGTGFMLLLPILLLLAGFLTWHQFHRIYGWYVAEAQQKEAYSAFSEGFSGYLTTLQKDMFDLSQNVDKLVRTGQLNMVESLFSKWLKRSIASDLVLDLPGRRRIKVLSASRNVVEGSEEDANRRITGSAIINAFDENGRFNDVFTEDNTRDAIAIDSQFVSEVINRWGRLYQNLRFHKGSRFSTVYLHAPGQNRPSALLNMKVGNEELLCDYVRRHFVPTPGMQIDFFLLRDDDGIRRFYSLFDDREVNEPDLIDSFNLAVISGQHSKRIANRDLLQIFAMNDYPLLLVMRSNNVTGHYGSLNFVVLLLIYAAMLLVFVFLVFMLIYLRPIREFIRVTEAVAAGDYQQQVELSQADEFGDLKTTFDTMIQGLEQRRRLSHFVSSEVIKAVESDSEESMAVGGERIDATIAFVQLEQLQHLQADATAEQIFAMLSDFIAAADLSAGQYGGIVDKLVEDTLMLVFRGSSEHPEHAVAASAALLDLEQKMRINSMRICAGIASGPVVSGRIGSRLGKLDFTVIGDTVNPPQSPGQKSRQYRHNNRARCYPHLERPRPCQLHRTRRNQGQKPRIPSLRTHCPASVNL